MLDIMKIIIYATLFFFFSGLFYNVSTASAVGNDIRPCKCLGPNLKERKYSCKTDGGDRMCADNEVCSQTGTNSIDCVDKNTANNPVEITCSCQNSGKGGPGNNGMTCTKGGITFNKIYCNPDTFICENGDYFMTIGANSGTSEYNNDVYDDNFKDKLVKGVTCKSPDQQKASVGVQCTCDPNNQPESGKNGFTCTGIDNKQYQMWCGDEDQQCLSDSKGNYVLSRQGMKPKDGQDTDDFKKNMEGTTARNIRCESEKDRENTLALTPGPTDRPPPLPPCANNTIEQGKCASFLTALGEMGTNAPSFTRSIFAILLSFSGGLALLLIIRSGYTMMTSQGNPQKIQEGRDQLVAAIVGLVFLIFSFVLLQLIGYDLLRIPGFGADGGQGTGTVNSKVKGG